jgi:hypothetical protein
MRVRLIAHPRPGELDEFDLRRYHVGEVYDLPPQLASILLIGRHAELAPPLRRDAAADRGRSKSKLNDPEF